MPHFGLEADRKGFFGELLHQGRPSLSVERMQSATDPIALAPGCRSPFRRRWPSTWRRERKMLQFIMTVVFARHCSASCCGNLCRGNNPYAIVERKARLALGGIRVA